MCADTRGGNRNGTSTRHGTGSTSACRRCTRACVCRSSQRWGPSLCGKERARGGSTTRSSGRPTGGTATTDPVYHPVYHFVGAYHPLMTAPTCPRTSLQSATGVRPTRHTRHTRHHATYATHATRHHITQRQSKKITARQLRCTRFLRRGAWASCAHLSAAPPTHSSAVPCYQALLWHTPTLVTPTENRPVFFFHNYMFQCSERKRRAFPQSRRSARDRHTPSPAARLP